MYLINYSMKSSNFTKFSYFEYHHNLFECEMNKHRKYMNCPITKLSYKL